jgi:hypothetical protein
VIRIFDYLNILPPAIAVKRGELWPFADAVRQPFLSGDAETPLSAFSFVGRLHQLQDASAGDGCSSTKN